MKQDIVVYNGILQNRIEHAINEFKKLYPDVDIHEIRIYGFYNYATKQVEIAIKTDVREQGQQFLGASS